MFLATIQYTGAEPQMSGGALAALVLVSIVGYIFFSYCYKRICEKAGVDPGGIIWVPIAQFVPIFRAAGLNPWLLLLLFVPFVNFVMIIVLFAHLAQALGKSPWLAALVLVPIVNILLVPYLAFSSDSRGAFATA